MSEEVIDRILSFVNETQNKRVLGVHEENLKIIEEEFDVKIIKKEDEYKMIGDKQNIDLAFELINRVKLMSDSENISREDFLYMIDIVYKENKDLLKGMLNDLLCVTASGKPIKPKTLGQRRYIKAMKKNDIIFGIGPAGTGKTYLAVAQAVKAFKNKEVNKIILTRPAVEAGEKLGFLPGDLQDKVDPYLRPLNDALFDILGPETFEKLKERGIIEIAPLAYMRGRTLDSAYVILDEAQNTTAEQMKMFLTRIGFGSRAIITGDITQVDLPNGKKSGLFVISKILKGIKGIEFIHLNKHDVVRHKLVQRIIEAYEKYEMEKHQE